MKTTLALLSILCFFFASFAQENNIPEPNFFNEIHYVSNNAINPLELQKYTLKTKSSAGAYVSGFGKTRSFAVVQKTSSNITFSPNDSIMFIFKTKDVNTNPSSYISLYQFTITKNERQIELASASLYGGSKTSEIPSVELSFVRTGENSFLIKPTTSLAPGEYGFSFGGYDSFYLFSIK